ncbi:MAG: F0F1 ATP synthase subunit delta [Methylophaga sp.]|uniref:F0F1 ATP synthase subunit delta n=1 Tax=Methylophaga sp. TaxID=2024840 RepID=UPI00299D8F19|nr:F0F1 ATP synthase subunit delta [Methylophaga sp.]MDX1749385.1 F0F1 ATP synthase subunit delta [Methylophaga sp.]
MLIDWFTVIAQVINFLILAWLLKRFLYRPILNAIDARENRIAAKIADANEKESEAQKQCEAYQQKNEMFDKQRNAHMNEVLEAAKTERAQLFDAARQESDDLRARLQQAIRNEQNSLNEDLSRRAREEVFAIARKALSDLADTSLEQRMTEIFLDRLRELDAAQTTELKSAFKVSDDTLRIRTAFKLSAQQKTAIETEIVEIFGKQEPLAFIVAPDLVSGIEINTGGRKIGWSIADYLGSLAKSVDDLLKNKSATEGAAPTNTSMTALQDVDNNER